MERASIDTRLKELMGHESWLRRFATSLVHSEAVADDLVQETWLAALRSPPSSDRPDRPWLARVVRNLARMRYRSDARRRRREAASAGIHGGAEGDSAAPADRRRGSSVNHGEQHPPTADELLARVQTQRMLADVVVELEEPYRTVILLHYFEGLSAAEIARREDIPPSTVRSRHKMGLDKLRRALDRRNGGNRHAWCLALQPFVLPTPAAATSTGLLTGILAMKTIYKLAIIAIALLALFLGVTALRGHRGDATPGAERKPDGVTDRAPVALQQVTLPTAQVPSAVGAADPVGQLRLEGQVIDENDAPVADALVAVSTNPRRTLRTEADGSFFVEGLLPRRYNLVATAGATRAGPIGVRLTDTSDPVILRLQNGATLEFEVVSERARKPVPDATVELRGWVKRQASADANGRVSFAGLPFGRYTIAAWAPGFGRESAIAVATEGTQKERITLKNGAQVAGMVKGPDGSPIAGARVTYKSMANNLQDGDWHYDGVDSDAGGHFQLPALARGTYRFAARHREFATGFSAPVTLDGVNQTDGVEIQLKPEGVLSGVVVSRTGEPVAAATVDLAMMEARWVSTRQAITDERGHFRVGGLPRGAIEAIAYDERATSQHYRFDLGGEDARSDVEFVLDGRDIIAGVVQDPAGAPLDGYEVRAYPSELASEPVDTSDLAWALRRHYRERTDAAGRFALTGLPPGDYTVRANPPAVSARGFHWMREGTQARSGDTEVKIVVQGEGRVVGEVAFADGSTPELFTVSLWDTRLDVRPFVSSDGSFAIDELPPGTYDVRIRGVNFEPRRVREVVVRPDQATDLGTIEVRRGRVVSGRVVDTNGQPVPGAEVMAGHLLVGSGLDADMGRFGPSFAAGTKDTMTDENGRFTLHGVASGRITIIAAHAEHGRSAPVRIAPGSSTQSGGTTTGLHLTLAEYGALVGTVTDAGKPAKQVQVIARSVRSPATVLMVGAVDGHFRFDRLAPDDYSVQAMPSGFLGGTRFHTRPVTVTSGATAEVALDMTTGQGRVAVRPITSDGKLANAMIFHSRGELTGTTAWELFEITGRGADGNWSMGFSSESSPAYITGLIPGDHTMCAVAFPSDVRGMNAMLDVLLTRSDSLPAVCRPVRVADAGGETSLDIPVEIPEIEQISGN